MIAFRTGDVAGRLPTRSRLVVLSVRLVCVLVVSVDVGTLSLTRYVHFGVALVFYPPALRWATDIRLPARAHVWISTAAVFHPVGMIYTAYPDYWWFDTLAHVVSATVVGSVAAVVYVVTWARRFEDESDAPDGGSHAGRPSPDGGTHSPSTRRMLAATTVGILVASTVWEAYELLVGYLTVYGVRDTVVDVLANLVGGLAPVALFREELIAFARQFRDS